MIWPNGEEIKYEYLKHYQTKKNYLEDYLQFENILNKI